MSRRLYYSFQFPPNKRASATDREAQAAKMVEESGETLDAVIGGEQSLRICEEAFDTIVAAEGLLRKFPIAMQDAAFDFVINKGTRRDDWSE